LHKAKGSNSCEPPAGGLSARLARPLRGGEQRFTVRHHAEALLQLGGATMYDTRTDDGIALELDRQSFQEPAKSALANMVLAAARAPTPRPPAAPSSALRRLPQGQPHHAGHDRRSRPASSRRLERVQAGPIAKSLPRCSRVAAINPDRAMNTAASLLPATCRRNSFAHAARSSPISSGTDCVAILFGPTWAMVSVLPVAAG
jgi:hypothetical protein